MTTGILLWKNVSVDVETARDESFRITAITKASPAVATYEGTPSLQAGDIIHIHDANGMLEVNERAFRIANINTGDKTFELEGENSTNYGALNSASAAKVTLGASFNTIQNVNGSGGEPDAIDITTIHDSQKREMNGSPSALSYSFTNFFKPDDSGYGEFKRAGQSNTKRVTRLTFGSGGPQILLVGYPFASGAPTGQGMQPVTCTCSIKVQGEVTLYAS